MGYFAYDTVRFVEPRLAATAPPDRLGTPDILLMVSEEVLVFDNLAGTIRLDGQCRPGYRQRPGAGAERFAAAGGQLPQPMAPLPEVLLGGAGSTALEQEAESDFTQPQYEAAVERVKEYVLAGDVMQVVPSQRMSIPFDAPPLNLYRALRNLNPHPICISWTWTIFTLSVLPEILARLEGGTVTVRPIAGTRRRGRTEAEDGTRGGVTGGPEGNRRAPDADRPGTQRRGPYRRIGSVKLSDKMVVERYSTSCISSPTSPACSPARPLSTCCGATLPGGHPEQGAQDPPMEIIDELEPVKRGVYGGAVGYISWAGDMDTCDSDSHRGDQDRRLYVQAGGGVVADSVPGWSGKKPGTRRAISAASMALAGRAEHAER